MTLPRFILAPERLQHPIIQLQGEEIRHLRSFRLQAGDPLVLADGQGREFRARVSHASPQAVEVERGEETRRESEPRLQVTLYQGMTKNDSWEWVIQKATELGVASLVPMQTARSQIRPNPERETRRERWQTIARQAAEQSGRMRVPGIDLPRSFSECLAQARQADRAWLLYEDDQGVNPWKSILNREQPCAHAAVLVGPEGGFAPEEVAAAQTAGIAPVGLGPRILRSETAGMVSVALLLYAWGDLGGNS